MATSITLTEHDVQEEFFARGWTDGLPVVPPTPERVDAMLTFAGVTADNIVGSVPERSRNITAEKAAINAVMAGCEPQHFPVVLAALSAMCDPAFGCNTAITSTGGAALCVVVSGADLESLGFNTTRNALGPGYRANATVGRAMRLVAMNVLGARSSDLDGSSIGHPGKYTMLVAEENPPEGWASLRVELGYDEKDISVTVLATEGPHQISNQLNGTPEGVLATFTAAMTNPSTYGVGKGHQVLLVLGYEHRRILVEGGWTRQAIREYLTEATRVTPAYLEAAGIVMEHTKQNDMTPGIDGKLATVRSPDDIFLITAGSAGAGWSAYIPTWAPTVHSVAVTKKVQPAGSGLPLD
tara:strand:+ start:3493 stop:4554 length:1062 start_codon:yes stop_codon:yes gene_type:complete